MSKLQNIKAIIFDLDNTLIDFMKMKTQSIEVAVDAMIDAGLIYSRSESINKIDSLYRKFGLEYQKIFDVFLKEAFGKIEYKILAAGVVAYRRVKEGYIEPYPHVTPTLIELIRRGYKIGIITDAPKFQAWSRLAGMNLHHYFDFVVSIDDTGVRKPNEMPFKAAINKIKLKPTELLMVGDDPKRDIEGANRLGIITMLAKYGYNSNINNLVNYQKPDYILSDIKDLLDLLPSIKRDSIHE